MHELKGRGVALRAAGLHLLRGRSRVVGQGRRRTVPSEALVGMRRRLDTLQGCHPDRARMVEQAAMLYGVSATTLHRQLRSLHRRRPARRADRGQPRRLPAAEQERTKDSTLIEASFDSSCQRA